MALQRPLKFTDDGWLIGVVRRLGPAWKQRSVPRPRTTGLVAHSMEGGRAGSYSVLDGPIKVSWTGSIMQVGLIEQHYDFWRWVWHCNGDGGNSFLGGWEFERRTGIPLRHIQLVLGDELFDAARDLMLRTRAAGWEHWRELRRQPPYKCCWEHNEVPRAATACPSERMIPLWTLVTAPTQPTPEPLPVDKEELTLSQYKDLRDRIDGTNNLLGMVGEVVRQNSALTQAQQAQIDYLITALVSHHGNDEMHTPGVAVGGLLDEEKKELVQDVIDEIRMRLAAGQEALDEAGKGIIGAGLEAAANG